ncbi:elongin C [Oleoguttula sp. CCFEE 5521]
MATLSQYVTLISSDDFSFIVLRSAACLSGVIRRMLDPAYGFVEARTNTCHFENISGMVLEKVCEYMYYNEKHRDGKDVPDMDIPPELCLELLMASDYLDSAFPPLLHLALLTTA